MRFDATRLRTVLGEGGRALLVPALFVALLLWAYFQTLSGLAHAWLTDQQYSHGFLVPGFALVLLWQSGASWADFRAKSSWWSVPVLVVAATMHVVGGYIYSPWLENISLLPALAGGCLAFGGWRALRLAAPAIAFLLFMIPLPGRLDKVLTGPLQRVGTLASTNALQTFGFFAQAEGNVIVLTDYELGVVEACSGLRMLMVFLATSMAVAVLCKRSLLQKVLIVLSAVPIALLCNVIRITGTGLMHELAGHEAANFVYHDLAGWLMAPMALVFLGLELWLFNNLFISVDSAAAAELAVSRRPVPA